MKTRMVYNNNGVCWEESTTLAAAGLRHGVTGRTGGVSHGAFASLNLALHVGDDDDCVLENRRRFCSAVGLDMCRLTTTQQTHEDHVIAVGAEDAGRGASSYDDALPHTDALMTNCTGIPLVIFTADCVPVILYDPVRHACAVVHDGWRGTAAKLAAKTVFAMRLAYGSQPQDMLAYIGPSIGPDHFDVGDEAEQAFVHMGPAYERCIIREAGHQPRVDLWAANQALLVEAGLLPEHIDITESCVYDKADVFFSYRRDGGTTGRMATFAVLDTL